jgi:hypothetical protein
MHMPNLKQGNFGFSLPMRRVARHILGFLRLTYFWFSLLLDDSYVFDNYYRQWRRLALIRGGATCTSRMSSVALYMWMFFAAPCCLTLKSTEFVSGEDRAVVNLLDVGMDGMFFLARSVPIDSTR